MKDQVFPLKVAPERAELYRKHAERAGVSISEWIRSWLDHASGHEPTQLTVPRRETKLGELQRTNESRVTLSLKVSAVELRDWQKAADAAGVM